MTRLLPLALGMSLTSLLLSGCEDPRQIDPASSSRYLYVPNPDHNTLAQIDLDRGVTTQIPVGREPTRAFVRAALIYVTNRAERSVSVFEEIDGVLAPRGTIQTGAEPFSVVATADRVYVSASQAGVVQEFDASTFALLRSFEVAGEPRGLALHPNGKVLVVASMFGGKITVIDLASGFALQKVLPAVQGFDRFTGATIELSRRLTSDPIFSGDGSRFAVGGLALDNTSPIEDPNEAPGDPFPPDGPGGGGYDSGKIQPMVAVTQTDQEGVPIVESAMMFSVSSGAFVPDAQGGSFISVTGYPSALAISDDNQIVLASIEGADAVVALDLSLAGGGVGVGADAAGARAEPAPGGPFGGQLMFTNNVAVRTSAAPIGLQRFGQTSIYVHSNFDRTVERISLDDIRNALRPSPQAAEPFDAAAVPSRDIALPQAVPMVRVLSRITLADRVVSAEVDYGRRLFFATNNPKVSTTGAAVSCGTCHFGGRNDGLTWVFTRGPRQTPSVAGDLSLTNPVGWSGDRATVAEDAMMTSQGLMGGQGLTHEDSLAIQAFVNSSRNVDLPNKGLINDQVIRGKALFDRSDVACASCHSGPAYTNNQVVEMFGINVKVRHLVGIAASAPFFHDGSAATLRDVLIRARDGSMGNTSTLSDAELDDLEAYLKTL